MRVAASNPVNSPDSKKTAKTIGYYLGFIGLGLTTASLGPTLPGLAEHTHTQLSQISFLFTARALGYLLGSLQGGRFYDRMQGHLVVTVTLVLMACMLALVPFMPLLWLLTIVLLFLGFGEGCLDVGGNTMLVWVHGRKVGPFMNGLHFFFGVGAFLSPIIIAQAVLASGDIDWAYWILALLMLPAALWILRLPSPTGHIITEADPSRRLSSRLVAMIAVFFFLYTGAEGSYGGWIFSYAAAFHLNAETAAFLNSAFWGALTIGRLLAIPIAARLKPALFLLADLVGCLVSLLILLVWPAAPLAIWVGTLGTGLFMASIFPTTITLAERRLNITGQVTGWFFVGASAGGMVLPWLIGQLFESVGPGVTMIAIAGDMLLAMGAFALLILNPSPQVQEA
jgi:FHS family Na+ dependent glucose MFS transporter 1